MRGSVFDFQWTLNLNNIIKYIYIFISFFIKKKEKNDLKTSIHFLS